MKWLDELLSFPFRDTDNIIHFSQDQHGNILVLDDGDYRILTFDSPFEQSSMSIRFPTQLVHPYTQYMLLVLAFIDPKEVALFGLGGGSLLRTLHYLLPDCAFNVIELRKKVVDIAIEYFHVPVTARVNITVSDALNSINGWETNSTDIIFSDMYDAYHMIEEQTQRGFLENCSRILTSKGWLVINLHSLPDNRAQFFEILHNIFPTIYLSANTSNTILLASNSLPEKAHPDLQRIEAMESKLNQSLKQLMPRIRPINFVATYQL